MAWTCCTRVGAHLHLAAGGPPNEACRYCGRTARQVIDDPLAPNTLRDLAGVPA